MRSRTFRHLLGTSTAVLSLLTAACGGGGDGTGPSASDEAPGTVVGIFDLVKVNGESPSTPWNTNEIEPGTVAQHFVTSAHIEIRPDSTLTVSETHRLLITGRFNRDLVQTVTKAGTFSFEPGGPDAVDNGRLHVTFENGATRTMELTQFTVTDTRPVPGDPGEGEVPLQLIYTRQ